MLLRAPENINGSGASHTSLDPKEPRRLRRHAAGRTAGGVAGGVGGFGVGAWFGDRFVQPAELQFGPAFLGLVVGASAGAALIVWFFLRGSALGAAGPTAVTFGAFVPAIFATPLLLEAAGDDIQKLLGTVIGLTLLASVLSRAAGVRIALSSTASRTGVAVAVFRLGA
jgi:hypothetical protein